MWVGIVEGTFQIIFSPLYFRECFV